MDNAQAKALVSDTFTHAFDKVRYQRFIREIVNRFDESKAGAWGHQYIKDAFKPDVERYERLGTYRTPNKESIDLLIVYLTQDSKLQRARTALRNFVAHHLKQRDEKDAALVAFVSPSERTWRFSFVKMEYATEQDERGKVAVSETLTPARRYSYLVGDGESCHTAQSRFLGLLQNTTTDPTLEQIEDAFSVETVTKEFFSKYYVLFERINGELGRLVEKDKALKREFEGSAISTLDFAKKLLGQIVFLYFIQKKGWLGVPKGKEWGNGPKDFLCRLVKGEYGTYNNFFNDVLEPLFYDTLATDRGHDAWCNRFKCRIPFLNGGLFEPLGDYNWEKTDIILPNEIFRNREQTKEGDVGTGTLDVFDRYNFTVNEAEPLEQEVAIDPEMLGKVFENLIEENRRKGLGAYYTPREIVHYMCQESLVQYLHSAINPQDEPVVQPPVIQEGLFSGAKPTQGVFTVPATREKISKDDLEAFIHSGEQAAHYEAARKTGTVSYRPQIPSSIEENARLIDDKLRDITVCDPAIGSGAFPVGMMTEIVRARTTLSPYFNDTRERTPYYFKRNAIQNSLYGADIDRGAVEIAKLRLWLSLVVDEEETRQIRPLPNLDFKIVVGNSLLGFPEGYKTPNLIEIERLKDQFFEEPDHHRKASLKGRIDQKINEVLAESTRPLGYPVNFDFQLLFSEVFRSRNGKSGGFDIVIGNPPYVRVHKQDADQKKVLRQLYKSPFGDFDIYVVFIEKGLRILRPHGILALITPDKYLLRDYGQEIRTIVFRSRIIELYDISRAIDAFGAAVYPLITLIAKDGVASETRVRFVRSVKAMNSPESEYYYPQAKWREKNLIELIQTSDRAFLQKILSGAATLGAAVGSDAMFCGTPRARDYYEWAKGLVSKRTSRTPKVLVCSNLKPYSIDHGKMVRTLGTKIAGPYFDNAARLIGDKLWAAFLHVPKILIRGNDTRITAVWDEEPSVFIGVYAIKIGEKTKRLGKFLVAALNSRLYQWVFLTRNPSLKIGGGFFSLNAPQLLALPFREPTPEVLKAVDRLVDKITVAKREDPKADTQPLEREIDHLIYHLYSLTDEEVTFIDAQEAAPNRQKEDTVVEL